MDMMMMDEDVMGDNIWDMGYGMAIAVELN